MHLPGFLTGMGVSSILHTHLPHHYIGNFSPIFLFHLFPQASTCRPARAYYMRLENGG